MKTIITLGQCLGDLRRAGFLGTVLIETSKVNVENKRFQSANYVVVDILNKLSFLLLDSDSYH